MKDRFSLGRQGGVNFSNVTNIDESESPGLQFAWDCTYSFMPQPSIGTVFFFRSEFRLVLHQNRFC